MPSERTSRAGGARRRSRGAAAALLALAALLAGGCARGTFVRLTVSSAVPTDSFTALAVVILNGADNTATRQVTLDPAVPFPVSVGISLENAVEGTTTLCVTALAGAVAVAGGCTVVDLVLHRVNEAEVSLAAAGCGNGAIEGSEACDGANLAGATCASLGMGFDGGTLACNADCTYDTAACTTPGGVPTVPVPQRPLNGHYLEMPSTVVNLGWTGATGAGPITYDVGLATEPSFAASTTESGLTTTAVTPTLPPGATTPPVGARWWWHVRACNGAGCSAWSVAWYFSLGRSPHDVDGDAFADLVVGAPGYDLSGGAADADAGAAYFYVGGLSPPVAYADRRTGELGSDGYGTAVAACDFDGDGFADVLVGIPAGDGVAQNGGRVEVYAGSTAGFAPAPTHVLGGPMTGSEFGAAVACGDVDGDGLADVVVGAPSYMFGNGGGFVYLAGAGRGVSSGTADTTVVGGPLGKFGAAVVAGDFDGDGYADAVFGAPALTSGDGQAFAYRGGPAGTDTAFVASLGLAPGSGGSFGAALAAGDLDGDALADLAVSAPDLSDGHVYVYYGTPAAPLTGTFDRDVPGPAGAGMPGSFGTAVAVGDVSGDGVDDLMIGAPGSDGALDDVGAVMVHVGPPAGAADGVMYGTVAGQMLGGRVSFGGNLDGDGFNDVVVSAPAWTALAPFDAGSVLVYRGNATGGFSALLWVTISGEDSGEKFGAALAP
ncbi:MAG TPA: hypothetical protein VG389_16355 [Myxococcota bacterium]|nr:hypothetical protein [Myxococcota bacterium]